MNTILENLENKQALIKKINVSISLNLLTMLLLFMNLYTVKIHLFVNEKSHLSEVICGFVLFAIILLNYLITLKWLKSIKLVRFSQNIRHLLNCVIMCWLLLAIFSEGRIALHEISIPLYLFFLIDLFFTLQQKNMLLKHSFFVMNKYLLISVFILSFILTAFLSFQFDIRFDIDLLNFFILCGSFSFFIVINSFMLFSGRFQSTQNNTISV